LEHHLNQSEEDISHIDNYTLGAEYCRQKIQKGGVSIFVKNNWKSSTLNLKSYCIDKNTEVSINQSINVFISVDLIYKIWKTS